MQKRIFFLAAMWLLVACAHPPTTPPPLSGQEINQLIEQGEYTKATQAIKLKIALDTISPQEEAALAFKIEVMERIKKDFNKDDSTVLAYIKQFHPEVTPREITAWEASGALECKTIDGEKKYFHSAHRNLFRIDTNARKHYQALNGRQSDSLDRFLGKYIPQVIEQARKAPGKFEKLVMPVNFKITYTLTVKPNEVPSGEIIRVWMPYPRENVKYKNIRLLSVSQQEYLLSPDSYPHKSIYMEAKAVKDSAAIFSYTLGFTSFNQWFDFTPEAVKPYVTESELYKKYTAEREAHVIFTPQIQRLTDSITAGEQNPYRKVVKIFGYIARNYPWASAREYSTIENIPQYVLDNKHGDCGQVSLLFITMARCAGIPAKWQSGWMLHPGEVNLHDWAEVYFEGIGWVPVDQSFGPVFAAGLSEEEAIRRDPVYHFFTKGLDAYRYIVNDDFGGDFYPAKIHPRSETVDFQRGEVEWRGGNLYFGRWRYKMECTQSR